MTNKIKSNVSTPIGLRQLKESYEHIEAIEKAHNVVITELRARLYAQVYLKNKIDKVPQTTISKALGVVQSNVVKWIQNHQIRGGQS